ncbi:hypothetical protein BJ875DRAFT_489382 [Amylocarpus encephaloides]|uniref:Uncharacterized protein n=1 Tax=Amylocarpus encephaloides TaxID=45428 RepID=A0A9P8C094_9HELO|nr:hypothetical protein BJ875DRAFT_489382 [Amylocarpus encephaloides]
MQLSDLTEFTSPSPFTRPCGTVGSDIGVEAHDFDYESDDSFSSAGSFHLEDGEDLMSFGCTHNNVPGPSILSTNAVRFKPAISLSDSQPIHHLLELSKLQKSASMDPWVKATTGVHTLEIRFREGAEAAYGDISDPPPCEVMLLENMRE